MKGRLKKFINWSFGLEEDQSKNERLFLLLIMATYYLSLPIICLPRKRNYLVSDYYDWIPFVVACLLQIVFGIAYRIMRRRRLDGLKE